MTLWRRTARNPQRTSRTSGDLRSPRLRRLVTVPSRLVWIICRAQDGAISRNTELGRSSCS
jgi:hypothetical protein